MEWLTTEDISQLYPPPSGHYPKEEETQVWHFIGARIDGGVPKAGEVKLWEE